MAATPPHSQTKLILNELYQCLTCCAAVAHATVSTSHSCAQYAPALLCTSTWQSTMHASASQRMQRYEAARLLFPAQTWQQNHGMTHNLFYTFDFDNCRNLKWERSSVVPGERLTIAARNSSPTQKPQSGIVPTAAPCCVRIRQYLTRLVRVTLYCFT